MSETVNNANTTDTSSNDSTDINNDNEFILSKEQQRVVDLCAREQVLELREKAMAKREIEAYASDSLYQLGFNDSEKDLAFQIINFNDNDSCKTSIDILSQLCESRALDIVNLRLRSKEIPKASNIPVYNQSRTQKNTFENEVKNLKNR